MTTATTMFVSIVVTLAVVDLRRWIPWLARRIVRVAACNFDERSRRRKEEEYRANLLYAGGPLSMLALALYTFVKAPFRARELRGDTSEAETPIAAQAMPAAKTPTVAWTSDSERSAAEYDAWYLARSAAIFVGERERIIRAATDVLHATSDLRRLSPDSLIATPEALRIARACTCPPMHQKQLVSACGANPRLVFQLESGVTQDDTPQLRGERQAICDFLRPQFDRRLLCWLDDERAPTESEREHALLALGERLAQSAHTPLIRREHGARQQRALRGYLESNGLAESTEPIFEMRPGSFGFGRDTAPDDIGVPWRRIVDCVVAPLDPDLPLVIIESVSSSETMNSTKRFGQAVRLGDELGSSYGEKVVLLHHLFGHFDVSRLLARKADAKWVWDHRLSDLAPFLGIS